MGLADRRGKVNRGKVIMTRIHHQDTKPPRKEEHWIDSEEALPRIARPPVAPSYRGRPWLQSSAPGRRQRPVADP